MNDDTIKNLLNTTADNLAAAAAQDLRSIMTGPDGKASMADVVWMLVRTVTTGRQMGGIIMYPDDLAEARGRLSKMLDIAIAGGWRGIDLLETLMARGAASDRLEALARKAGRHCDNRPDLLRELFAEMFGADAAESFTMTMAAEDADLPPQPLPPVRPATPLRRPMCEHITMGVIDGEEQAVLSAEAMVTVVAQMGHDPAQASDCADGGAKARAAVQGVLKAAAEAGYSRVQSLRTMLTSGPYGRETLAACEHLTGECGPGVITRGMGAAGFNFKGA